jgi:hypothetical protein
MLKLSLRRKTRLKDNAEAEPLLEPVGPDEIAEARAYLQQRVSFDIDEFLESQTIETLLTTPLGPTPECLSVEQIAELAEGHINSGISHVRGCRSCREDLDVYARLRTSEWLDTAPEVGIFSAERIRIPEGGPFYLVLENCGPPFFEGIDPASVRIEGVVEAAGCRVEMMEPIREDAVEAVALHFDSFKTKIPDGTTDVCDWLRIRAETAQGALNKTELVHVLQE